MMTNDKAEEYDKTEIERLTQRFRRQIKANVNLAQECLDYEDWILKLNTIGQDSEDFSVVIDRLEQKCKEIEERRKDEHRKWRQKWLRG